MGSIAKDVERVARQLDALGASQMPFATARALTMTAADAQKAVRAELPNRFTIRRNWVPQGVRTERATKQSLTAWVYHKDAYMPRQEIGGFKTAKQGGGDFSSQSLPLPSGRTRGRYHNRVAVPTTNVLRTKRDLIRESDKPKAHGAKAFPIELGAGKALLVRRFAKGKRAGLTPLYVLKPSTWIKPRWGFGDTVRQTARDRFRINLEFALDEAMKTRK